MSKITQQQRWNRYVRAINYCIEFGFKYELWYIDMIDSKDNKGKWNGNVRAIRVVSYDGKWFTTIPLKPKKYKPTELLNLIFSKFKV